MSLSLSNSLRFAKIPLVKIGETGKNSLFFILQLQFHREAGLIQQCIVLVQIILLTRCQSETSVLLQNRFQRML